MKRRHRTTTREAIQGLRVDRPNLGRSTGAYHCPLHYETEEVMN